VVLVLHGGGGRGTVAVSPTQLSVLRMVPVARRVARAGRDGLAVLRLLNAVRGFGADPLTNVRWALEQVRARYPDRPVGLVGHSLGGSVALAAGDQDGVEAVVALAPWVGGTESTQHGKGTRTLIVHGSADRVTSCPASQSFAARARAAGAHLSFVEVQGGEHTMLRHMAAFDVLAARYVAAALGRPAGSGFDLHRQLTRLAHEALDRPDDYRI
jgi:hypothetical protein